MAYSELIKNFSKIRSYMRQFYVYGFKSREEFDAKSARSYDNERRRIESWLGDYMSFRQDANGKSVFLSVDSRTISHNPLYKGFQAKSFTDKDITLHFYIMDILANGDTMTSNQIVDAIDANYLSHFEGAFSLDESTVRKKLKEYEELGYLVSEKQGREVKYRRSEDSIDLESWSDAVDFFSEASPIGVIGTYVQSKNGEASERFGFKHHYILHALDSEILCDLLSAISKHRAVEMTVRNLRNGSEHQRTICPLKIYSSTQGGRQYVLGYHYRGRRLLFFRVDAIEAVKIGNEEKKFNTYLGYCPNFEQYLWGVSLGSDRNLDHLEMTIRIKPGETYILDRLEREKRHGTVEVIDDMTYRFTADVYDAAEMLPWLRTFIGRVLDLQCSNQFVVDTFFADIEEMKKKYAGGDDHAVQ